MTAAAFAARLNALSDEMADVAVKLEYYGGLNEFAERGKLLSSLAHKVRGWGGDMAARDAVSRLAAAPVAVMDIRDGLGLCALKEEDFPTLIALKGRRVAIVDLGEDVCTQE